MRSIKCLFLLPIYECLESLRQTQTSGRQDSRVLEMAYALLLKIKSPRRVRDCPRVLSRTSPPTEAVRGCWFLETQLKLPTLANSIYWAHAEEGEEGVLFRYEMVSNGCISNKLFFMMRSCIVKILLILLSQMCTSLSSSFN